MDLMNFARIGIVHPMAYPNTVTPEELVRSIERIATDDYFDVIEIAPIEDAVIRKQVSDILTISGMTTVIVTHPLLMKHRYNLNDLDLEKRKLAVLAVKNAVNDAHEMGAESVLVMGGSFDPVRREESITALITSLCEICEDAEKQDPSMRILLEIFDDQVDKKSIIGPAIHAAAVAQEVFTKHNNFGLLVDLSHIPLLKETSEITFSQLKRYVRHVHIGNCVMGSPEDAAYGDHHPRFGFPNSETGVPELVDFLQTLVRYGYGDNGELPIISFECKPYQDEKTEWIIANAKRTLNLAKKKMILESIQAVK